MDILRTIVMILFVLICIALIVVILMQESKTSGLSGAINGVADTYWGKNKGRSMEGKLVQATKVLAVLFFIVALALNMTW
ncbi:MAG TPA: preprotein translocase subunit SecG [Candidatus Scybalocola faecavium]|nr:preprotein translocase subunit SecG [Candidatus Scybalocola faecavium]